MRSIASFNPKFTYSIFGDEEAIVGYQGLKISLRFNASDMRPNLHVSSSKKLKAGEIEPTDIQTVLKGYLADVAFQKPAEFEQAVQQAAKTDYRPPGERIRTFVGSDGRYEIWKGTLSDPAVLQLVKRIEIFVPFFIEGGTFIAKEDATSHTVDSADRWSIFFLYRTRQRPGSADSYEYEFAGYSTVYRFLLPVGPITPPRKGSKEDEFSLPPSDEDGHQTTSFALAKLPCRSRISQFIVLPPFQGKGNAGRLYSAIFDEYLEEPQTTEITVEDPNEAFDDLRDIADLAYLSKLPAFTDVVRINKAVKIPRTGPSPRNIVGGDDPAELETLRHTTKIAPRQFNRVVEMYLMQKLAPSVRPTLEEEEEEEEEDGEEGKSVTAALAVVNGKGKSVADSLPPATPQEEHEYKLWRLFVKQRLYRHNKEILGQLERSQRIDKLEETLVSVELEYARILSMFESRAKLAVDNRQVSVKRKLTAEEEAPQNGSKRARVEDA